VRLALSPKFSDGPVGWGHLEGTLRFEAWDLVEPWYSEVGLNLRIQEIAPEPSLQFKGLKRGQKLIRTHTMERVEGAIEDNPAWRWDAGEYPAGRYRLHVDPLRWSMEIAVPSGERSVVDVRVPELARTTINLSVTGGDLSKLSVYIPPPKGTDPSAAVNESPPLIPGEHGSLQMISAPGAYSLGIMWKSKFYEQEVDLLPGWNSILVDVDDVRMSTIELTDNNGRPHVLERGDWDHIAVRSKDGERAELKAVHLSQTVDRVRYSGYSRANILFKEAGVFEITGFDELGISVTPTTLELKEGAKLKLVVSPH
jgi:hypothetical protein